MISRERAMRVGVVGTGAVGGYFGGILAREGHSVCFIARPRQLEAILNTGLSIRGANWETRLKPPQIEVSSDPSSLADCDGILLCVKSTDTETASLQIRDHFAPQAWVMSLQNGVDNPLRAQQVLHRPVIPAVVYVATAMPEPGLIEHFGRGDLVIGPPVADGTNPPQSHEDCHALLSSIRDRFCESAIPVAISDRVQEALWSKLLVNCAYNAISALAQLDYGSMSRHGPTQKTMLAVVEEVVKVSEAAGIGLDREASIMACEKIAQAMPKQLSSTAQDLARKKRTEIDHLNGFIVREGERLSVPTPVNQSLYALVKLIEQSYLDH